MLDPGVKDQSDHCESCLIGTAMREEAKDALVAKDSPTGWQSDRWGSLGGGSRGTPPPHGVGTVGAPVPTLTAKLTSQSPSVSCQRGGGGEP